MTSGPKAVTEQDVLARLHQRLPCLEEGPVKRTQVLFRGLAFEAGVPDP